MKRMGMVFTAILLLASGLCAQEPIGIFDDHMDIGEPGVPGWVEFDSASGRYLVDAVGATIGNRTFADEFHFAYKKISGSFAIEANPYPLDDMGRGGLMIRQDTDPDSAHISLLMTSGPASDGNSDLGSVFPTFRTLKGGGSIRDGDPDAAPGGFTDANSGPIRLERIGNSVHMYRMTTAGEWVWFQSEASAFTEEVLAGLAATAENTNNIGYFEFTDVVITELPFNVMRDLPTDTLTQGATLTGIQLTAQARSQVTATIQELMPIGAKASNVKASAGEATLNANGSITWLLTDFTGEATLTYDTTLGQRASAAWRGTFNDGVYRESYIGGEALLPKAPQFAPPENPIDIDPLFPTIIQAEQGKWIQAETDFGLMLDLKTLGGISVVGMMGAAQYLMEYPINIQQAGTYYLFGRVRGEDGNSDSLHFEIDDFPVGDGTTYWTISSKKAYANEWLSRDAPREDPRAFELTAGVHYLYLANREDSTSIDWLCVTNNRNMAITTFSEETDYTLSRKISDTLFVPGKNYDITIARAASSTFSPEMSIIESPPANWTLTNLKSSAGTFSINEQGQILWSLAQGIAGSQTLTYTLTPPRTDLLGGKFTGIYLYQGEERLLPGDTIIAQAFSFKNVNVANPTPIKLVNGEIQIEAEDAYLRNSSTTNSFSIRFDPEASEELYTYAEMSPSSISGDELNFVFEVSTPGTYRVIVRSRTPNGTDDSFYVGMDDDIQAVIPGYRFQGKVILDETGNRLYDDKFHVSWLDADESPDLSWDLSAGVHRLRIHAREDGTQLDWVIITNNLEQNPDDLEEPSTWIDHFMLY